MNVVKAEDAISTTSLEYWIQNNRIQAQDLREQPFNQTISDTIEFDVSNIGRIGTFAITGSVELLETTSLIRIVLIDDNQLEWLVFEQYPLLSSNNTLRFEEACRETCISESISPRILRVELIDAALTLNKLTTIADMGDMERAQTAVSDSFAAEIRALQNTEIVNMLNTRIEQLGLRWVAGQNEFSMLSYAEKKRIFSNGEKPELPNLQGFDFYISGIYEFESDDVAGSRMDGEAVPLVESFNWRKRHGADNPDSPYYDGDPTKSGWVTSVKRQLCNDCWAQCAVGAVETQANLYFNQHLNLDLSEQQIISCANSGTCANGGFAHGALNFIRDNGVVNEDCFRQTGVDSQCTDMCTVPRERVRIGDVHYLQDRTDNEIKRELIKYGPITFGIVSWWHCMLLIGYDTDVDGSTIWIVKNSWGDSWGENGYSRLKVPQLDRYLLNAIEKPIYSDITNFEVACFDYDNDGYANWGIGDEKPLSCPDSNREPDCDDFNSALGSFNTDGSCKVIFDFVNPPTGLRDDTYSSNAIELFWDRGSVGIFYEILLDGVVVTQTEGISYFDESLDGNASGVTMS